MNIRARTCYRAAIIALIFFFISMLISATVTSSDKGYIAEYRESSAMRDTRLRAEWPAKRKKILESEEVRKSVFLFSYMRGGSTLLEQLMGEDERVIAWYEPLSALYGHLYGMPGFRIHTSIVFDKKSNYKTFRPIGKWEMDHLIEFFTNLFSCNLNKMPVEFLSNSFITRTKAIDEYTTCYKDNSVFFNKTLQQSKIFYETNCHDVARTSQFCESPNSGRPQSVSNAILRHCDVFMEYTRAFAKLNGSPTGVTPEYLSEQVEEATGFVMKRTQAANFIKLQMCFERIAKTVEACSETTQITQTCSQKRIRTAKVLRLKMPYMEPIIQAIPGMFVLFYVRDPRAIAKSRMTINGLGTFTHKRWVQVTCQLCDEMFTDIAAAEKLNRTYPGVIQRVRYEDLVLMPKEGLQQLYASFGESHVPEQLTWLLNTMNAKNDGNSFSVQRSNASRLVDAWRGLVPRESVDEVNSCCKPVLAAFDYEP